MKIKTITCHDVYNVGASLQAYALETYLKQLGHEVEIIDYKPEYLSVHYKLFGVNNPKYNKPILREAYLFAKLPIRLKNRFGKRKREFDRFTQKYLLLTSRSYHSNEELKSNPPVADVYFAGSDQIWNTLFRNGKDPAFYLDFAPKSAVKASYAASFSTEDVLEEWKPQVKKWIENLDYVSVRELSGIEIAKGLGIENVVQVLDPVYLLDMKSWETIEQAVDVEEPYVFLYDFDNNDVLTQFAYDLAKKNGWKVYSFLANKDCDRCFKDEGPLVFLWLVHNAEFVVSNSFHATAFSLIFQKQFVVFNRKESINTRMRDLLTAIGLEKRMYDVFKDSAEDIDYKVVKEKLNNLVDFSQAFISKVLNEVSNEEDKSIVYD